MRVVANFYMLIETIFKIIDSGMQIWNKKTPTQAQVILEKRNDLRKRYDYQKSLGSKRDDDEFTRITIELCDLGDLVSIALKSTDT